MRCRLRSSLGFWDSLEYPRSTRSGRTKSHPVAVSSSQQAHHLADSHSKRDVMEIRAGLVPMCTAKWPCGFCRKRTWRDGECRLGRSAGARRTRRRRITKRRSFFVRHGEALEIRANDVTSKVTSILIGSEKPSTSVNRPKPCLMFLLVLFSQSQHVMVVFHSEFISTLS